MFTQAVTFTFCDGSCLSSFLCFLLFYDTISASAWISCLHVHKSQSNSIKLGSVSQVVVYEAGGEGIWTSSRWHFFLPVCFLYCSDDKHFAWASPPLIDQPHRMKRHDGLLFSLLSWLYPFSFPYHFTVLVPYPLSCFWVASPLSAGACFPFLPPCSCVAGFLSS